MNYLAVDLYQDFECIADACPNTCCAGWTLVPKNISFTR